MSYLVPFQSCRGYRANFGHCVFEPPLEYTVNLRLIGELLLDFLFLSIELFFAM